MRSNCVALIEVVGLAQREITRGFASYVKLATHIHTTKSFLIAQGIFSSVFHTESRVGWKIYIIGFNFLKKKKFALLLLDFSTVETTNLTDLSPYPFFLIC